MNENNLDKIQPERATNHLEKEQQSEQVEKTVEQLVVETCDDIDKEVSEFSNQSEHLLKDVNHSIGLDENSVNEIATNDGVTDNLDAMDKQAQEIAISSKAEIAAVTNENQTDEQIETTSEDRIPSTETRLTPELTEAKNEKLKYTKFIDSTKSVINILNRRNDDRLSSLIDEPGLGRLRLSLNKIDEIFSKGRFSEDDLVNELNKISSTIDTIGDTKRGGKENIESLTVLITKLKSIGLECGDLIKTNPNSSDNTIKALYRLTESCDLKSRSVARIREAFANYTNTRR